MYNIIQLNGKDLSELQAIAKELGIQHADTLKKDDLVYSILDEQAIANASKKAVKEKDKEAQPRKRTRISVKKEGDKVYTASKDKAQKLEANTPEIQAKPLFNNENENQNEENSTPETPETVVETKAPQSEKAPQNEKAPKKRNRKSKADKPESTKQLAIILTLYLNL